MKIIRTGDRRAESLVKKKVKPERQYRLSCYTFSCSEGSRFLLKNTLTGRIAALSPAEKDLIGHAKEERVSGSAIIEKGLGEFVESGFLIPENDDEYEIYRQTISLLRVMSRETAGAKSYTILPTTGCNARCVYCYEEGLPVCSMNEETALRVADFIEETCWDKKVKLTWFGGEPLLCSHIISVICRRLEEKHLPFSSGIVTNASLLTPEMLKEAISVWHLESAQVSADGKREDYEKRKQYVNTADHHYETMMRAVGMMLQEGIRVTIRCNYDKENIKGATAFFDDLKARFGSCDHLSVYPAMLYQEQARADSADLYRQAQELRAYLRKTGLKEKNSAGKQPKLKLNHCMADSGDKCVVIAPDGRLFHCEHMPGNKAYGSVYDGQPRIRSDERAELEACGKCRSCCFLPECTPFFQNGCVDRFDSCRAFKEIDTEAELRRLLREIRPA